MSTRPQKINLPTAFSAVPVRGVLFRSLKIYVLPSFRLRGRLFTRRIKFFSCISKDVNIKMQAGDILWKEGGRTNHKRKANSIPGVEKFSFSQGIKNKIVQR